MKRLPVIELAAYEFVQTMVKRADDPTNLLWHGWALREAFKAGAKWQKEKLAKKAKREPK